MKFINLERQHALLKKEINKRIDTVYDHGIFIMGPEVYELESQLASFVGVKHCISCGNGTDALQLALMSLGIGPGDGVITTAFSFFATAEAIALVGAKPIFVDIDLDTYNIATTSISRVLDKINKDGDIKCKAIIPVDMFGLPANYEGIRAIADKYSLKIIEDGAQGFGGQIGNERACSFGDISTTSFFPAKPLGGYGDGGALFTNSDEIADTLRSLTQHGKGKHKYSNERIGMNSRLDTMQAAILLEKLKLFENELVVRNEIAANYLNRITDDFYIKPKVPDGMRSSWAQFTLYVNEEKRSSIISLLSNKNIPTSIYYPTPLHKQPPFINNKIYSDLENSERASKSVFSIPMSPYLLEEEQRKVVETLNSIAYENL
jgi:dTDP-4-amino-4,6-dideoxygalactose transaminase